MANKNQKTDFKIFSVRLTKEQFDKLKSKFPTPQSFRNWIDSNFRQIEKIDNKCVYRTYDPSKNIVLCAKDWSKKSKIHKVSVEFCNNCWKRRQAIMSKKGKIVEEVEDEPLEVKLNFVCPQHNIVFQSERILQEKCLKCQHHKLLKDGTILCYYYINKKIEKNHIEP